MPLWYEVIGVLKLSYWGIWQLACVALGRWAIGIGHCAMASRQLILNLIQGNGNGTIPMANANHWLDANANAN